jgi:hypothetical protein
VAYKDAQLRSSRQNNVDGRVVSSGVVRGDLTQHAQPQYSIDCS